MEKNWEKALSYVLANEGEYVNNKKDPGGETNYGVTYRVYYAYRKRKGLPIRSVRNISQEEVSDIYKMQYWDKVQGDLLPSGVDYCVFDFAVNSGPVRAAKTLQQVVKTTVDGSIGLRTLDAIEVMDAPVIICEVCKNRLRFLTRLRTWNTFRNGWKSRIKRVEKQALALV